MSKSKTKAERQHLADVAALGCCICGGPAEVHHLRDRAGMAQRSSHLEVIPLCPSHHRTGGVGVAIHAGRASWERNHGSEAVHLADTERRLAAFRGAIIGRAG